MSVVIGIAGMIGSGKTTFINNYTSWLSKYRPEYSVSQLFESVDDNPLLPLMYEYPERWTFTSQMNFLLDKVNSLVAKGTSDIVLIERDYEELLIFADIQRSRGHMTDIEHDLYIEFHKVLEGMLPKVHKVYLDIPYDRCRSQITKRGREFEFLAEEGYYKSLYQEYIDRYISNPEVLILPDNYSEYSYMKVTRLIDKEYLV